MKIQLNSGMRCGTQGIMMLMTKKTQSCMISYTHKVFLRNNKTRTQMTFPRSHFDNPDDIKSSVDSAISALTLMQANKRAAPTEIDVESDDE